MREAMEATEAMEGPFVARPNTRVSLVEDGRGGELCFFGTTSNFPTSRCDRCRDWEDKGLWYSIINNKQW